MTRTPGSVSCEPRDTSKLSRKEMRKERRKIKKMRKNAFNMKKKVQSIFILHFYSNTAGIPVLIKNVKILFNLIESSDPHQIINNI